MTSWLTASSALLVLSLSGFVPSAFATDEESTALPIEELRLFSEVFQRIKTSYVEPVSDSKLINEAIRGMLAGLDPHSQYLDRDEFASLQEHTRGEFGGLGIELGMDPPYVRVIAPIDDTPAQKAGILAGDLISKIDDSPVAGLSMGEVIELMRGEPGEPIQLTILREGTEAPIVVDLKRAIIHVSSVKSRMLGRQYGYLRIAQFQSNTGSDLEKAIKELESKASLKGYVLDLRNNPGGVLGAAVEVADSFIDDGLLVYTEGRFAESEQRFHATKRTLISGLPLVVLVNGGSASASEIVAGALQDHGRAILLGERTFGKGSVQTILPVREGRGIKMTTARYFTPGGRSIQANGILPDVIVAQGEFKAGPKPQFIAERDLSGHLENQAGEESLQTDEQLLELASEDFQLYEAVNLLKVVSIVKGRN